jgi:predicted nucleotidyltransferase component of viral defense system
MSNERYSRQVELLLQVLPLLAEQKVFALKGGTAINLFMRDMPRLSVDIDVTHLPLESRECTIEGISRALSSLADRICAAVPYSKVQKALGPLDKTIGSLVVSANGAIIKIEPNFVLRGSVFPCEIRELCESAQTRFSAYAEVTTLSFGDVFGGKLCAVLDRQHPRDLFDAKLLLENEGITTQIRQAFVLYLASHRRPMHELLDPSYLDMRTIFQSEFVGMSRISVSYESLEATRAEVVQKLRVDLSDNERRFLVSVKAGAPQWDLIPITGIDQLPGIQWKLQNIARMEPASTRGSSRA